MLCVVLSGEQSEILVINPKYAYIIFQLERGRSFGGIKKAMENEKKRDSTTQVPYIKKKMEDAKLEGL